MLDSLLLKSEEKASFFDVFLITFVITVVLSFLLSLINAGSIILISLIALALTYPTVNYMISLDKEELSKKVKRSFLFQRHSEELVVFWGIFFGTALGFIINFYIPLVDDFSMQKSFVSGLKGMFSESDAMFLQILFNNLNVVLLTFILSLLIFSGLIFILVWNSSILAYYIFSLGTHEGIKTLFLILPHTLLEIGGYIFAGIAGSLLAYRIEKKRKLNKNIEEQFMLDFVYLLFISIFMIILAAVVETL